MTYREARIKAACRLKEAGVENENFESGALLELALHVDYGFFLLHQTEEMPAEEREIYENLVSRRCERIPLQHLSGVQQFMGLDFRVNDKVLIPRQDTETLVEEALGLMKSPVKVLDLCTGSGCIAISLSHYHPEASVTATDIDGDTLAVAKENNTCLGTGVKFLQSDLFENVADIYDLIVSNPPYIASDVIPGLMPEVRDHEPMKALDGGTDGLDFYRQIIRESSGYLTPGGYLLFEIGYDQGDAVSRIMEEYKFTDIKVVKDLAGLDRVVRGRSASCLTD